MMTSGAVRRPRYNKPPNAAVDRHRQRLSLAPAHHHRRLSLLRLSAARQTTILASAVYDTTEERKRRRRPPTSWERMPPHHPPPHPARPATKPAIISERSNESIVHWAPFAPLRPHAPAAAKKNPPAATTPVLPFGCPNHNEMTLWLTSARERWGTTRTPRAGSRPRHACGSRRCSEPPACEEVQVWRQSQGTSVPQGSVRVLAEFTMSAPGPPRPRPRSPRSRPPSAVRHPRVGGAQSPPSRGPTQTHFSKTTNEQRGIASA